MSRERTVDLPAEVIDALIKGRKIEAIKLLREAQDPGLAEAKAMVEAYRPEHQPDNPAIVVRPQNRFRNTIMLLSVALAFGWALANSVIPVSSLIVLWNQDGYVKTTFTIDKIQHSSDHESGLYWGFSGRLLDREERLYAPDLADAKTLEYRGLRKLFPAGTRMDVWHNPQLSDTLFQKRTLRVLPCTPDLLETELERISWWLKYCLLPLLIILIIVANLSGRERN